MKPARPSSVLPASVALACGLCLSSLHALAQAQLKSGSGFAVSRATHVVTNAHVVEQCRTVSVRHGMRAAPARVVALDRAADLAVLETSLSVPGNLAVRREPPLRLGESVIAFGFPLSGSLSQAGNLTMGNVSALAGLHDDAGTIQISAPVQPGSSGGPLLDASGNVVGVVTAKLDALSTARRTGDIPQNVNFAVRGSVLERFLQSNGVRYEQPAAARPLEPADIADIARSAAVRVECTASADATVVVRPARPSAGESVPVPVPVPGPGASDAPQALDGTGPVRADKDRAALVRELRLLQVATPYPTTSPELRSLEVRNDSLHSVRRITVGWLEYRPAGGCPASPSGYAGRKDMFISLKPGESSTAMASFPARATHFCIVDALAAAPASPRAPPAPPGSTSEPGTVIQPPAAVDPLSIPIPDPTVDL